MERRLAAILAADVVGYSRLMEADEEARSRGRYSTRSRNRSIWVTNTLASKRSTTSPSLSRSIAC